MTFQTGGRPLFLFGAGENCAILFAMMKRCGIEPSFEYIADNCWERYPAGCFGYPVKPPGSLRGERNPYIIVTSDYYYNEIRNQLQEMGFLETRDFINAKDALPGMLWEQTGLVAVMNTAFHVTTRCSLKCRFCLQRCPYLEDKKDRPLEAVQEEIADYFNIVDYVYNITLVGGEPMMYRHLERLLAWLFERYPGRMELVNLITNGTIMPSEKLLAVCRKHNVRFDVSDYGPSVNGNSVASLIALLGKERLQYVHVVHDHWTKMWRADDPDRDEAANWKKFKECNNKCRTVYQSRYAYCAQLAAEMFMDSGYTADRDDYFDLRQTGDLKRAKAAFVQYNAFAGREKCFTVCAKCNGSNNPKHTVPPGEQITE